MLGGGVWGPDSNNRLTSLEEKYVRTTRFAVIGSGTSGQITLPGSAEVVLDDFGGTTDAVVSSVSGGKPTTSAALSSLGAVVASTFDASGNYSFTDTPASYPVALIYRVQTPLGDFDSTSSDIWGEPDVFSSGGSGSGFTDFSYNITDGQSATSLSGQSIDSASYSSAWFICEVIRGTTVHQHGMISMTCRNGTWKFINDGFFSDNAVLHGLTFSIAQTLTSGQLKVALDAGAGDGTLKVKRILFAS